MPMISLLVGSLAFGQDLASFEKRLTEYRTPAGLTFLIYERPEAPVVSFFTYVDVGAAQESFRLFELLAPPD